MLSTVWSAAAWRARERRGTTCALAIVAKKFSLSTSRRSLLDD
ncbi:MAG: hypothetical protein ACLQNE_02420 [Thermoguttaceae bacterium]